jgi:hypothetical protein
MKSVILISSYRHIVFLMSQLFLRHLHELSCMHIQRTKMLKYRGIESLFAMISDCIIHFIT